MIQEIGKYYLYRHIRLDTKVPFYIGIGTKIKGGTFKRIYKRAFETNQEMFRCIKCGHEGNADFEASLTIKKRGQSLLRT